MSILFIDCETYSTQDLVGPNSVGSSAYAWHPDTEVILWSVRAPDWNRALVFEEPDLFKVLGKLKDASRIAWTKNERLLLIHWSSFDRLIVQAQRQRDFNELVDGTWNDSPEGIAAIEGPRNTFWIDLQNVSLTYGGPSKLAHAAEFFGGGEVKDVGKHLINRFCKPTPGGRRRMPGEDPIRWEEFRSYAGQDTDVMVPILGAFTRLDGGHHPLEHWWRQTLVDRMGDRGIPIDEEACSWTLAEMDRVEAQLKVDCEEEFGFVPSQTAKLCEFLGTPNVQKETIDALIKSLPEDDPRSRAAKYRRDAGGAARKKIKPMLLRADLGRVYGAFMYHAAWTSRLASYGVQFQNFVREPYDPDWFDCMGSGSAVDGDLMENVRTNIRGYVKAEDDKIFVAADYNAIECRSAAWLANERWLLDMFERGEDPYLEMASDMFGERITDKKDPRRQEGKIVELASMYQLSGSGKDGTGGLVSRYLANGMELEPARADEIILRYRTKHRMIVSMWAYCGEAYAYLVNAQPGSRIAVGRLRFERWTNFIKVVRPSGFAQYYWHPHFTEGTWPGGEKKINLCYWGRIGGAQGKMIRQSTYGGDIFQGANQGTAADLLFHGMSLAERAGFPPIIQVHDEMVSEIDRSVVEGMGHDMTIKNLCEVLCMKPDWAEGLPVVAEGYVDKRFTKV